MMSSGPAGPRSGRRRKFTPARTSSRTTPSPAKPVRNLQIRLLLIHANLIRTVGPHKRDAALFGYLLLQADRPIAGVNHHAAKAFILEIAGVAHRGIEDL